MSKFKIIVTAVFVVCIIAGVIMFATYKSNNVNNSLPMVTIWGTFSESTFNNFVDKINQSRPVALSINYVQIPEANFRTQFIEELANGKGPDAILIPQDQIIGYSDKIVEIPNTLITQRDFQNTFAAQANLYITNTGTLAIPFITDPLVMYWNRTIFTNAGIANYPVYWDEFSDLVKKITVKDENSNIRRAAIALGEFKNINNAREVLSTIILQSGNPITYYSQNGLLSALGDNFGGTDALVPAINFYTEFSNPRDAHYSWNRSLPSAKNTFIAGNLATYFGFASELGDIRGKNPNLDFDIAPIPQIRTGSVRTTYGNMYGISIVKSSTNETAALTVIQALTSTEATALLSQMTYLPSTRRDMIASSSKDPYMAIFLDASLISKGWLDRNPVRSNSIFTELIESVTSGTADTRSALKTASDQLDLSLKTL